MRQYPTNVTRGGSARRAKPDASDTAQSLSVPSPSLPSSGATGRAAVPTAPSNDVRKFRRANKIAALRMVQRVAYVLHDLSGVVLSIGDEDEFQRVYGQLRSACDGILSSTRPELSTLYDEELADGDYVEDETSKHVVEDE